MYSFRCSASTSSRRGAFTAHHNLQWNRLGSNNVNNYGVGEGPAANLLRIIRDAEEGATPNVTYLYNKAVEAQAGVHSRTHMKGLLNWMRKIGRVRALPPEGKGKHFSFSLTEKGAQHIAKIDQAMGIHGKSQQPQQQNELATELD